jgi:hypothetical protein
MGGKRGDRETKKRCGHGEPRAARGAQVQDTLHLVESIVQALLICFNSFGSTTAHKFATEPHKGTIFHLEFNTNFHLGDRTMAEYKNYGQAGAMGEKARSDYNTFVQPAPIESIDLAELAKQLVQVRAEMKKRANPDDTEQDAEIGAIAQAERAAKAGDKSKALEFLKGAGKFTLEVAKSVTAGLVKDVIEGKF